MITNRPYYSWSQHSLFKSSKLQFYKRYVLGLEGPRVKAFDKGTEFAEYREKGIIPHWCYDNLLEAVSEAIPRLDITEKRIEIKFGDITLLSYIDECAESLEEFSEFKTGKDKWTQSKVDAHRQLDFYALSIYLLSGEKIIPKCTLYWIETMEVETPAGNELRYTGYVEKFERQFTLEDIINIGIDITKTHNEIKEYEHEEIELEESKVDRYLHLLEEQKKIKDEIDLIKLNVLNELNLVGAKYASSKKGRFSISQRKTPIYSKDLLIKEKKYKDEIDKLKTTEKGSPETKYSITESLRFNVIK